MANVLITYDLKKPGQNYDKVYEYLQKLPARRGLESVWFARTDKTPKQIRDELQELIDANDRIFVCVIGNWASRNLMNSAGDWLHGNG